MKILLAQFIFESNTFNVEPAELELFTNGGTWLLDEASVRQWCVGADSQLAGSLRVLEAAGCEVRPVFAAMCGTPAGRLSRECFGTIREALATAFRAAWPADAILLHLHGAACAVGEDDVEGNILEMVRQELGFSGRLVASLDLHANVTRRMLQLVDAITAYRTMPHIDFGLTGERAARLLLDSRRFLRTMVKVSTLIPPTDTHNATGPFAEILAQARQLETRDGVADVSVFPVQPWLDVAEMGTSVVVTATPDVPAEGLALKLAHVWYAQRWKWRSGVQGWGTIQRRLSRGRCNGSPWVLVDSADATTGGSCGGSAEAIAHLLPLRETLPGVVLLWVVDATACRMADAGEREVRLGIQQCRVAGEVLFRGEGRYRTRSSLYRGIEFSMGRSVVLATGQLRIVISTHPVMGADPAFFECVGLDPHAALAVHVKSLMGWRAGYGAPAERGLVFDGPGSTSLNFAALPFTGPRRELFPVCDSPPHPVQSWQSS